MILGGILASVLLAGAITVAPPPDRPEPGVPSGAVTLITGDRVVVTRVLHLTPFSRH
ncbi:hypothetical protein ACQEVF_43285 [Nonomuraea polychroma]|uniref:hypothetical protein n=1 Tax=Nonomuraea polychroma TaxID=46176 RepID=UPI003D9387E3